MSEEPNNKCAHPACDCPTEEGSKYCGEYCKNAEKSRVIEIGCSSSTTLVAEAVSHSVVA
jgi:hypothetical protein